MMMTAGLCIGSFKNRPGVGLLQMPVMLEIHAGQETEHKQIKGEDAGEPIHGTKVVKVCQNGFRAQKLFK